MVMVPGAGAIRSLVVSLRLDDGGFRTGIASANAATDATAASMARATQNVYAMRAQLAILGFASAAVMGKMLKDAADFEKQVNVGAFAAMNLKEILADQTVEFGEFDRDFKKKAKSVRKEAMALSKELALDPIDAASLVRQVQQFGIGSAEEARLVARAGAKLSIATGGEIAPDKGALAIYKLLKSSGQGYENSDLMAEYINIAAQESAADPAQIERFLRRFQIVGTATRMKPEEIVALTAAITDLDSGGREYFSSATLRLLTTGFDRRRSQMRGFLGMGEGEFSALEQDKAAYLMTVAATLKSNEARGQSIQSQLQALGLDSNVRDQLALTTAAIESGKYSEVLALLKGRDMTKGLLIDEQVQVMLGSLAGRWDALTSSMKRAGIVMGTTIGTVLKPLMIVMTEFFNLLADHPALAAAVGFGALALVLAKMVSMFRAAKGAAGDLLGILTGIGARMYGPTRSVGYAFAGMGYGSYAMKGGKGGASAMGKLVAQRTGAIPVTYTPPSRYGLTGLGTSGAPLRGMGGRGPGLVPIPMGMSRGSQTRFPYVNPATALLANGLLPNRGLRPLRGTLVADYLATHRGVMTGRTYKGIDHSAGRLGAIETWTEQIPYMHQGYNPSKKLMSPGQKTLLGGDAAFAAAMAAASMNPARVYGKGALAGKQTQLAAFLEGGAATKERRALNGLGDLALAASLFPYGMSKRERQLAALTARGKGHDPSAALTAMAPLSRSNRGYARMAAKEMPSWMSTLGLASMFTPFGRLGRIGRGVGRFAKGRLASGTDVGVATIRKIGRMEMKGATIGKFNANLAPRGGQALGTLLGRRLGGKLMGRMAGSALGRAGLSAVGLAGPIGLITGAVMLLADPLNRLGNAIMNFGSNIGGPVGWIVKWFGVLFKTISLAGNFLNFLAEKVGGFFSWIWTKITEIPVLGDMVKKGAEWVGELPDQMASGIDNANAALTDGAAESVEEARKRGEEAGRSLGDGVVRANGGRKGAGGTYIVNNSVKIDARSQADLIRYKVNPNAIAAALGSTGAANTQGG